MGGFVMNCIIITVIYVISKTNDCFGNDDPIGKVNIQKVWFK